MCDPVTGTSLAPIPTPETKPLHPTSVYAVTKRDHEELFLTVGYAYRIPTVALRYFNIYGERQALSNPYTGVAAIFSARVLNGQPPVVFEDGEQSRDFVHVSDVVRANLLALETDHADYQALNVGTGRPTTVRQVADAILGALGARDLAPTVLDLAGPGDTKLPGRSLARLWLPGSDTTADTIVASVRQQEGRLVSIAFQEWRYIHDEDAHTEALYHFPTDRLERWNMVDSASGSPLLERYRAALTALKPDTGGQPLSEKANPAAMSRPAND